MSPLLIGAIAVAALILLQIVHMYISAPIKAGHVVSPGIRLSKCGIKGLLGGLLCENAHVTVQAGKVSMYDADNNPVFVIHGQTCSETDESCVPGLHFTRDKTLNMGGKPIKWVEMYDKEATLSPWPFEEEPVVKSWRNLKF